MQPRPEPFLVQLEGVGKRYGARAPWVLEDVNLELRPGSLTVVSGANGSGKSTLLRIVGGSSDPTRGTVRGLPSRVAVVPDRFVAPRLTTRAYLRHHGRLRGLSAAECRARMERLSEQLRIAPGLDVPLQALSQGNARKVGLAQAFLAEVDLLVLDEPSAALDRDVEAALWRLVAAADDAGTAVLVAEHNDAVGLEARHLVLTGGRLEPRDSRPPPVVGTVQVTLRATDFSCRVQALPGLGAEQATVSGDSVTVEVDVQRSDRFLADALEQGWSVVELRRTE
jgi:ABC-2 type transport system ATP-binding protein